MTFENSPQSFRATTTGRVEACIRRLGLGDDAARDEPISLVCDRMQLMARRMLRGFPHVRRWDETGDVVQNAIMRLYRSLGKITPRDSRGFLGLAAVHIRRELLDLARKHRGPESFAANHETDFRTPGREARPIVDKAVDRAEPYDQMARWTLLHESAERLPTEEQELFNLVWYLGVKQDEAAQMLDCSIRTVKRRWDSVKQLLRESLDEELRGYPYGLAMTFQGPSGFA